MMDRYFIDFDIAGFTHYDGVDVFQKLQVGTELRFVSEPNNQFDGFAVALYYKDSKLGYIPRQTNTLISKFLNLGYENLFEVKINKIMPNEHPEQQIGVVVRIKKKLSE